MLRCQDVTDLASDMIDGRLPFRQRLQMRLHLAVCKACRAYLDQLRKTIHLVRGRAVGEAPAAVEAAVLAAVRARTKEQQ